MAGFREIKDRARRDLHTALEVPAFYIDPLGEAALGVTVRVHNSWLAKGDVPGTSFRFGEIREDTPKLIFLFDQIDPEPLAVVMISAIEGYRVRVPDPRYLQTVMAGATALDPTELALYPNPDMGMVIYGNVELPGIGADEPGDLPGIGVEAMLVVFNLIDGEVELPLISGD
jgi:hypothetical protein